MLHQRWTESPPKSTHKETHALVFPDKSMENCECVCLCVCMRESGGEREKEREKLRDFNDILFLSGILLKFNFQIFNLEPGRWLKTI